LLISFRVYQDFILHHFAVIRLNRQEKELGFNFNEEMKWKVSYSSITSFRLERGKEENFEIKTNMTGDNDQGYYYLSVLKDMVNLEHAIKSYRERQ